MLVKMFTAFIAVYVLGICALYFDAYNFEDVRADYAVVFGNKVEIDGRVSDRLEARLLAAFELYQSKKVKKIAVSGGIGVEGYDEASVMAAYLISKGVPNTDVLLDHNGDNSHQTSKNVANIVGVNSSVVAVTQQYHISRAKMFLEHAGFVNVKGHYPHFYELRDVYSAIREVLAWIKYWVLKL